MPTSGTSTPGLGLSDQQSGTAVKAPLAALRTQLVIRRQSLRQVALHGLKVRVRCSAACALNSSVLASRRTARRLGLRSTSTTLGRAKAELTAAGVRTLSMRVSRRMVTRLRGQRSVKLSVRLVASDSAGKLSRFSRSVTLKR